jgi:hypothetical protein
MFLGIAVVVLMVFLYLFLSLTKDTILMTGGDEYDGIATTECVDKYPKEKDRGCCFASLSEMRAKKYKIILSDGTCPTGFKLNQLLCVDSLKWCEPVVSDIQTKTEPPTIKEPGVSTQQPAQTVKTYKGGVIEFQYPSSWVIEQTSVLSNSNGLLQAMDFNLPREEIMIEPGSSIPLSLQVKIFDALKYKPGKIVDNTLSYIGHTEYLTPKIKTPACGSMSNAEFYENSNIENGYDVITRVPIEKNGKIFEFYFSYGVNGYCMQDSACRVNEEKIIIQNEEMECKILSSVMFAN